MRFIQAQQNDQESEAFFLGFLDQHSEALIKESGAYWHSSLTITSAGLIVTSYHPPIGGRLQVP